MNKWITRVDWLYRCVILSSLAIVLISVAGCADMTPEDWDTVTKVIAIQQGNVRTNTLYTSDGRRVSCTTYTAGKSTVTHC